MIIEWRTALYEQGAGYLGPGARAFNAFTLTPGASVVINPEVLSQKVWVVTAVKSSVNITGAVRNAAKVVRKISDQVEVT